MSDDSYINKQKMALLVCFKYKRFAKIQIISMNDKIILQKNRHICTLTKATRAIVIYLGYSKIKH